jgi:hypothetical protein
MKRTITLAVLFFSLFHCRGQNIAPSVINAGGGTFQAGYYQFEWSIGELALIGEMSSSNNSLVITNGFIQPFIQYPATNNINSFLLRMRSKFFPILLQAMLK